MAKNPVLTCDKCGRTWNGDVKYAGTRHTECKGKGSWSLLSVQAVVTEVAVTPVVSDSAFAVGDAVTPNLFEEGITFGLVEGLWYQVAEVKPGPVGEGEWYDLTYTFDGSQCIIRGIDGKYLTGGAR